MHESWLDMEIDQIIPTILAVIPSLKKKMHARKRAQDRELISAFVKKNELRRKERKFKELFSAIFNRYRRDIDQIVNDDGTITADPLEVHDAITAHLHGWHRLNYSDRSIDWGQATLDQENLLSVSSLRHVPTPLLGKMARSLTRHSQNKELKETMSAALNAEVSYEEYTSEVRSKANKKVLDYRASLSICSKSFRRTYSANFMEPCAMSGSTAMIRDRTRLSLGLLGGFV